MRAGAAALHAVVADPATRALVKPTDAAAALETLAQAGATAV